MKKPSINIKSGILASPIALVFNLLLVFVAYALCRVVYVAENYGEFAQGLAALNFGEIVRGSLLFDASAIVYTNLLYILLMLLPHPWRETKTWQRVAWWVYVVVNSLMVCMNIGDAAYFNYTGRRTTWGVFSEFGNENNLGGVFAHELLSHWYLVVAGVLVIAMLCRFSRKTGERKPVKGKRKIAEYYVFNAVAMLFLAVMCVGGMRGGLAHSVRPITISNANQYVNRPIEAAIVLNTPFSMIRTVGKSVFRDPKFMTDEEMTDLYTPVHAARANSNFRKKNVVIMIVESFGKEYIGALNRSMGDANYPSYTPFIDSLVQHSHTFEYSFANGRKSIEAMPSILSGIPSVKEPFILTPASMNRVGGIAAELNKKGYATMFFHGAENGSMGFQAFARQTGFKAYFGKTEYDNDPRFGGDKDFDGMWAIWDEPFLQFMSAKLSEQKEPFLGAVFTASSHHPFNVPAKYKDVYKDLDGNPLHKCIRYTDMALRRFFDEAKRQQWYDNTLFVITADHTNIPDHEEYKTDLGLFSVPIIFFDPSGELVAKHDYTPVQQTDIMPSVLGLLGYDEPFVAFGNNVFATSQNNKFVFNYQNGVYQYVEDGLLLQMTEDGTLKAVYKYTTDPLLKHNLIGSKDGRINLFHRKMQAIVQQYMQRMVGDELCLQ